jgi:hypothetical protein
MANEEFWHSKSGIQLFKISYQNFQSSGYLLTIWRTEFRVLAIVSSENGDTLILANHENDVAYLSIIAHMIE